MGGSGQRNYLRGVSIWHYVHDVVAVLYPEDPIRRGCGNQTWGVAVVSDLAHRYPADEASN
jgi:hypothetical protein